MDIRLGLMTGIDLPIEELQITIHQPTIREISYMGEEGFFIALQFLCLRKQQFFKDKSLLDNTTNFQVFMTILQDSHNSYAKQYVISLLTLLFPQFKVLLTPQSIILNDTINKQTATIDENNFEIIQQMVRDIFCVNSSSMGDVNYNPGNAKAQEIADKIMRGKQRLAAEKGEQRESVLGHYLSVLSIGTNSLTLKDMLDYTVYQIYDLMERYSLYVNWDLDIRARLAGGKPDEKPDNWMKNIHS